MVRIPRPVAVLGAALLMCTFAACGDDDDNGGSGRSSGSGSGSSSASSSSDSDLIDAMVSEGATEEEARCFVEALGDDAERLFGTPDDADLSEEDQDDLLAALEACTEG